MSHRKTDELTVVAALSTMIERHMETCDNGPDGVEGPHIASVNRASNARIMQLSNADRYIEMMLDDGTVFEVEIRRRA